MDSFVTRIRQIHPLDEERIMVYYTKKNDFGFGYFDILEYSNKGWKVISKNQSVMRTTEYHEQNNTVLTNYNYPIPMFINSGAILIRGNKVISITSSSPTLVKFNNIPYNDYDKIRDKRYGWMAIDLFEIMDND
jgi:hypothetical protein